MTRKKFLNDLNRSRESPPAQITNIERYEDDGVGFTYWYLRGSIRREVGLKLITTNVDEYPDGNQFMLFTDDLNVDTIITDTFAQIQAIIDCSSISTALREISGGLHQALTLGLAENPIDLDSSSQPDYDSELDEFDVDNQSDDDANFGLDELLSHRTPHALTKSDDRLGKENAEVIRRDLIAAKEAGFKIGVHGDLSKAGIICISIRVTKLGISEEAMQAWGLSRNQYFVLLIRFQRGYRDTSAVIESPALTGSVEMRVGLSDTYKPNVDESFAVFNEVEDATNLPAPTQQQQKGARVKGSIVPLFIGRPINDLLRERFPKILKFRDQFNLSWSGAERLFNDRQGALLSDLSKDLTLYREVKHTSSTRALPRVVMEDALSKRRASQVSLPLVSMQFVLRHFVRCTEFCLVCHCKVEDTFEALKPYVCSNRLCLYQFLALGFGPAAEWEILSQPYVVDLLISLCYSQARASKIREFPCGINLRVPILPHFRQVISAHGHYQQLSPASTNTTKLLPEPVKAFKAYLDLENKTLSPIADSWAAGKQRPSKGDWLVLDPSVWQRNCIYHCRISDEQGLRYVLGPLNHSVTNNTASVPQASQKEVVNQTAIAVDCYMYDANFDELPDQHRLHAITLLLDNLPSVKYMRDQLLQQQDGHREANLNVLRKKCPAPALDLLRWIIASNRSCIMQVDKVVVEGEDEKNIAPSEDRVSGMNEWMQFRFAQGAPDKEQRFVDCVRTKSTNPTYPTLFAWHGSPLYNWHSIIRQGLNFDEVVHGRSCGHGVYMSPFLSTSMGYTNRGLTTDWPNSELKVSTVVSLQEVVNAPSSFVCTNPHFVVAQKDWIQTRYLFVKTTLRHSIGSTSAAKVTYQQDPAYTVRGMQNENVAIPITAISKSRRPGGKPHVFRNKKRKTDKDTLHSEDFDDGASVMTDENDRDLLVLHKEAGHVYDRADVVMTDVDDALGDFTNKPQNLSSPSSSKKRSLQNHRSFVTDHSKTDFVPDTLDTSGIRFLPPPQNASVAASKALLKAFNETVKLQEATPLHDLGFYIDPNRMENMYQWIVELHSFDKTLPLAKDMKAAGVSSIVFEMLFTNDYPFSPPFIRVVKPRFLDPMMGGGGHITSGGAICMELLTSTGWSAVNSIESVLLQVRLAMSERDRPARLLSSNKGSQATPYSVGEAIAAYKRFCDRHGWRVPKGLDSLVSNY